jgi:hypothetical protein
MYPSSETEFRPRGLGLIVLVGRWGRQVRGPLPLGRDRFGHVYGCGVVCVLLFAKESGSPRLFRGPLWLSLAVAPEPLRWYPLGSRRG